VGLGAGEEGGAGGAEDDILGGNLNPKLKRKADTS